MRFFRRGAQAPDESQQPEQSQPPQPSEQDEAADEDYCICGLDQHERAKAVRDSLHDLEPFTVKELRL